MLTIEIVSDIVCPWCFIGLRRLDVAIAKVQRDLPDFTCEKRWRPFFLNPDTPPEGEPYLPFLEKKFGGRAPVEALFERVRAAGRPYGIEYAFEKIERRANTLLAHRLIYWAQQRHNATSPIAPSPNQTQNPCIAQGRVQSYELRSGVLAPRLKFLTTCLHLDHYQTPCRFPPMAR